MKLKKLKINTLYHCDTEEKANELLNKLHDLGYKWSNDNASLLDINEYENFGSKTCYSIEENKKLLCGHKDVLIELGYKVTEYELDKKLTNGEFFNKQLLEIAKSGERIAVNKITKKPVYCSSTPCNDCLLYRKPRCEHSSKMSKWWDSEYKAQILDDEEKEYLSNVIKPFRNRIKCILKYVDEEGTLGYISIELIGNTSMNSHWFRIESMYKGLKPFERYTLEDLEM